MQWLPEVIAEEKGVIRSRGCTRQSAAIFFAEAFRLRRLNAVEPGTAQFD
jgi:hypothetical protein